MGQIIIELLMLCMVGWGVYYRDSVLVDSIVLLALVVFCRAGNKRTLDKKVVTDALRVLRGQKDASASYRSSSKAPFGSAHNSIPESEGQSDEYEN